MEPNTRVMSAKWSQYFCVSPSADKIKWSTLIDLYVYTTHFDGENIAALVQKFDTEIQEASKINGALYSIALWRMLGKIFLTISDRIDNSNSADEQLSPETLSAYTKAYADIIRLARNYCPKFLLVSDAPIWFELLAGKCISLAELQEFIVQHLPGASKYGTLDLANFNIIYDYIFVNFHKYLSTNIIRPENLIEFHHKEPGAIFSYSPTHILLSIKKSAKDVDYWVVDTANVSWSHYMSNPIFLFCALYYATAGWHTFTDTAIRIIARYLMFNSTPSGMLIPEIHDQMWGLICTMPPRNIFRLYNYMRESGERTYNVDIALSSLVYAASTRCALHLDVFRAIFMCAIHSQLPLCTEIILSQLRLMLKICRGNVSNLNAYGQVIGIIRSTRNAPFKMAYDYEILDQIECDLDLSRLNRIEISPEMPPSISDCPPNLPFRVTDLVIYNARMSCVWQVFHADRTVKKAHDGYIAWSQLCIFVNRLHRYLPGNRDEFLGEYSPMSHPQYAVVRDGQTYRSIDELLRIIFRAITYCVIGLQWTSTKYTPRPNHFSEFTTHLFDDDRRKLLANWLRTYNTLLINHQNTCLAKS